MPPKSLPKGDHFARHCGYQKLEVEDGQIIGVFPQAFELKAGDDGYLSGGWLEFFEGDRTERLRQTVVAMRTAGRTLSSNSALVEVHVGGLIDTARDSFQRNLRVLHEPDLGENNQAYATVRGIPTDAGLDFLERVFVGNSVNITQVKALEKANKTKT